MVCDDCWEFVEKPSDTFVIGGGSEDQRKEVSTAQRTEILAEIFASKTINGTSPLNLVVALVNSIDPFHISAGISVLPVVTYGTTIPSTFSVLPVVTYGTTEARNRKYCGGKHSIVSDEQTHSLTH